MKPNIILILVMRGIILIMGASSHPTSKELKSQLSILKETNPEYIQTLKDAVTASYKAELQAIKPSSTEEEEQLNGLLENTQIVFTFIDGYMKPAFYFEIPRDTNRYLILGILDEAGYPHCCLLVGQPKTNV